MGKEREKRRRVLQGLRGRCRMEEEKERDSQRDFSFEGKISDIKEDDGRRFLVTSGNWAKCASILSVHLHQIISLYRF